MHGKPVPLDLQLLTFADSESRSGQIAMYTVGQTHAQLVLLACGDKHDTEQAITGMRGGEDREFSSLDD